MIIKIMDPAGGYAAKRYEWPEKEFDMPSSRTTYPARKKKRAVAGEIGQNVPKSTWEMAEDFLEVIYRQWRDGKPMGLSDFVIETGENKTHLRSLIKKLTGFRYIEIDEDDRITLTDLGKMRGKECLERHQKLTIFFQMVSGMDEEEAEKDACRVEHTISRKAMDGIARFITDGDIYDRCYSNMDLSALYNPGKYEMAMGIYEIERRHPRILARECELFEPYVCLEVTEERGSRFCVRRKPDSRDVSLWYKKEDGWEEVPEEDACFYLPSHLFNYTVSANFPVTEGILVMAVTEKGKAPLMLDGREMNIHVI